MKGKRIDYFMNVVTKHTYLGENYTYLNFVLFDPKYPIFPCNKTRCCAYTHRVKINGLKKGPPRAVRYSFLPTI